MELKTIWLATVEKPNEPRKHRVFTTQASARYWATRERGAGDGTWSVQLVIMET